MRQMLWFMRREEKEWFLTENPPGGREWRGKSTWKVWLVKNLFWREKYTKITKNMLQFGKAILLSNHRTKSWGMKRWSWQKIWRICNKFFQVMKFLDLIKILKFQTDFWTHGKFLVQWSPSQLLGCSNSSCSSCYFMSFSHDWAFDSLLMLYIHTGLYLVYLQNKISRCNFLSEVRFFFFLVQEIRHWSIMRHLFGEGEQGLRP